MNKSDLEVLTDLRLDEAKCLLSNGKFHGAYYLCGYAIECALKACIAKSFQLHEFPNKRIVNDSYSHDLGQLLRIANLHQALTSAFQADPDLEINWSVVKDWSEQFRYDTSISKVMAEELIAAAEDNNSGVLKWVKTHW
ncbi:HEPN domain-containing protein [Klebsiella pneumoniae]|uniref:HEPN domain-containing protein n=1 Tax=Klebsiella pneumoniae complex TaxID=3390273 RepID=UPI000668E22E|nr:MULTISPECIES: HEPN domain-containing protein [Klebsiella]MCJ9551597.1 HEPN domain-containing protein [Klebsiella quasipneumoniae]EKV3410333.1 HEPN domain-containing protein [Klebsiella variicola]EMB5598975.1 HEPN domain-containing protein [Klebsiella pneumoniae]MBM1100778.1 HEPN domain-containing protein [Klebsiella pneumoniae]MBR7250393.1 HEPN domain-containing protein [Klebsiella pneumoniae]